MKPIIHSYGPDMPYGIVNIDAHEVWLSYTNGGYDGRGSILARNGDGYYLGSLCHCSCYGPLDTFNRDAWYQPFDVVKAARSIGYVAETDELFNAAGLAKSDTRPVACVFCGHKMYYSEHTLHEDEVRLKIENKPQVYAHTRCLPDSLK